MGLVHISNFHSILIFLVTEDFPHFISNLDIHFNGLLTKRTVFSDPFFSLNLSPPA